MEVWNILKSETVFEHRWYTLRQDWVQLPDGRLLDDYFVSVRPDVVLILAVTPDGYAPLVRQYKHGVQKVLLELPGGFIDPHEPPEQAARRELLEETGYRAERWHALGQYVVDGNRGAGIAHLFLAEEAQPVAARNADDLEEQELLLLSRTQIEQALAEGQFKVLPWTTVVALALLKLGQ